MISTRLWYACCGFAPSLTWRRMREGIGGRRFLPGEVLSIYGMPSVCGGTWSPSSSPIPSRTTPPRGFGRTHQLTVAAGHVNAKLRASPAYACERAEETAPGYAGEQTISRAFVSLPTGMTGFAIGAIPVGSVALFVAGCGGGGKGDATPGNPSNNTSVCAYTKRVGSGGRVYVQMAVTPVSLEPTACSAFNGSFGGRRTRRSARWGRATCTAATGRRGRRTRSRSARSRPAARRLALCRSFHPGQGFKRDV
jgi:hypothetical protein